VLDKAIKLKADADLLTRRGQCKSEARDHAGAVADFEAAIKLDEKFAPAHFHLGKQLCAKDKKRGLIELDLAVQNAQAGFVEQAKQGRDDCSKGKK
jgi:hypothetical protein